MSPGSRPQVVEVAGDGYQRGRAHGESLRAPISDAFGRWMEWLAQRSGMDPSHYLDVFLEETPFLPTIEALAPDLLSEVRGIAEGADVPFRQALAWQCMDEYWWHLNFRTATPPVAPPGCSGFAVWAQGEASGLVCQNDDLPDYFDGAQCVLRLTYPNSELEILTFTLAGMINQNGVNSFSTGVMVNTLYQLDHSADGLPATFVTRRILESRTLQEAIEFVTRVGHASGMNYLLAGPRRAVCLECSANKAVECILPDELDYTAHTNHPLCSDDSAMYRSLLGPTAVRDSIETDLGATSSRLAALNKELKRRPRPITPEDAKSILRMAPLCVPRGSEGGFTAGCTVVELGPSPVMHVAFGPPDTEPFHKFGIGRN